MSVRIITEAPPPDVVRPLVRLVRLFIGGILLLIGLVALVLAVTFGIATVAYVLGDNEEPLQTGEVLFLIGSAAAAVIGLWLGIRVLRGRRRLALFLRKFGFSDATEVLSFAVGSAMGDQWRLATLDDTETEPVGVAGGGKRVAGIAGVIGLAVVGYGLYWFFGGGFDAYIDGIETDSGGSAEGFEEIIGAMFAEAVLIIVVIIFVGTLVIFGLIIAGVVALFSFGSVASARRAERGKALDILTEPDIDPAVKRIHKRSRRVFGPRLTVVRVANTIWKDVVHRLARSSSAIVIDVSQPTENLLWEVESLRPGYRSRWVLIGEEDSVRQLSHPGESDPGSLAQRLAAFLDGESILAYESEERGDIKRFVRLLRRRLRQLR